MPGLGMPAWKRKRFLDVINHLSWENSHTKISGLQLVRLHFGRSVFRTVHWGHPTRVLQNWPNSRVSFATFWPEKLTPNSPSPLNFDVSPRLMHWGHPTWVVQNGPSSRVSFAKFWAESSLRAAPRIILNRLRRMGPTPGPPSRRFGLKNSLLAPPSPPNFDVSPRLMHWGHPTWVVQNGPSSRASFGKVWAESSLRAASRIALNGLRRMGPTPGSPSRRFGLENSLPVSPYPSLLTRLSPLGYAVAEYLRSTACKIYVILMSGDWLLPE